jgi:hypothetical protein
MLKPGARTCYFGRVDVESNNSASRVVLKQTEAWYRTRTSTGYTQWRPATNTNTWSYTECGGAYEQCRTDGGMQLCLNGLPDTAANNYGYGPCYGSGGTISAGGTEWRSLPGHTPWCGAWTPHAMAINCSMPVDVNPGEQVHYITRVWFDEGGGNWSYYTYGAVM